MPRLLFAVFTQRASVDRYTNVLDLLGIVEGLTIAEPPKELIEESKKTKKRLLVPTPLTLVTHWRRKDPAVPEGTCEMRVQLRGPKSELLATALQEFQLREHVYMRNLLFYQGLAIAGPGTYTAVVQLKVAGKWQRCGEAVLQLDYSKQDGAPQPKSLTKH